MSFVKLVPNGADLNTFKPLPKEDVGPFNLLYSGGIGGYYRIDVILKALRRLFDKGPNDIVLTVVGSGDVDNLLSLASELDILKNIDYKGVIHERIELASLIAKADVGLIPYDDNPLWSNALPAKFFEYCACGIPVIATAHKDSLIAELIKNYQIGLTSKPMDEEKLAEAIYWMYKNRTFTEGAGKRARTLIEDRFDRTKIAEEFLKMITALG